MQKYDANAPRYTSYPTANHFTDKFGAGHAQAWLPHISKDEPVSIYLHIPFCKQLCRYCGCHTKIPQSYDPVKEYADALMREIETVSHLTGRLKVSHIHWGGGTPTYLADADMEQIFETLSRHFDVLETAEHAIEIDPRTLDQGRAFFLKSLGVNRASLGVQEFDPDVQEAIGRVQPFEQVKASAEHIRAAGITAINFDMITGLPLQTEETVKKSMELAVSLNPDRFSVFAYAHVPWFKQHQKSLESYALPDTLARYDLTKTAFDTLKEAGYVEIGIDHFAKPEDEMARACKDGKLRRNFQGYTTDDCKTLLGFGASAISALPKGYLQNSANIKAYREQAGKGLLAHCRGVKLSGDDRECAEVIEQIMCSGKASFCHLPVPVVRAALTKLSGFEQDGIIEIDGCELTVTKKGRIFTRLVCTAFDGYWQESETKHAKAV